MFKLNLERLIELRGVQKKTGFLVKLGFTYSKAMRFLENKQTNIKLRDLERFCIALNCTPNDLLEWKPDANPALPETHALRGLIKDESSGGFYEMVKDIPAEKLKLVENLLAELKK